ncbi:streptomycin 6-kinase [Stackebrandtia endophytica]|uniref:Streptomycin 6-kinase n=1 Tax=Stackebrandtia endophytica TaxID=1496996 RepID=A0A543B281_9ACTN|nr:aminoglycoside phosphotransferase family protein [Stackebrandtia endophytica]TQL78931.1 streptomycin 6-kinase [Stackebrandtia endophytica]
MALVPGSVDSTIRSVFGERGERWLTELPDVVARLCRQWDLEVTGEAMTGGTHSYVAPVRRGDGTAAALKITVPDEENIAEASALYCYDGDDAVRLYAFDVDSKALLLELAVPGTPLVPQHLADTHLEGQEDQSANVALGCALYRRLWRVPGELPDGYPEFPTVVDMVEPWQETLPKAVADHADEFDAGLAEEVVRKCGEVLIPDGPVGIVNRDTHLGNIIAGRRRPWLLIDPKPLLGERAFDAGFLTLIQIESRRDTAFARRAVERTAEWLGVSAERVRTWALLRAVEEVSWGDDDFAARCVVIANRLHQVGDLSNSVE